MSGRTANIMIKDKTQKIMLSCFLLLTCVFFAGCAPEQKAVSLYVDAVVLTEAGENRQAVEKLNSAVEMDRNFSLAYSLLGRIYRQLQDYQRSADSFETAAKLNPWSFRDFFNLGRVYQIMQKFRHAAAAYARACQLKADHLAAHINAARCYYEIADFNSAIVYGKRAEQIDPDAHEIHKILGDVYHLHKDYDQAVASYKRAMEIDSNDPGIMTSLAVAYLKTGRNEPARELLVSAIRIRPNSNDAYQYLGYCYLQLNSQAMEAYTRQKETDTADTDNTDLLTSLKARATATLDRAVESYSRAIEINDRDWQAYRGLGAAYMLRAINHKDDQLKAKAIQQWHLSLDIKPDQPRRQRLLKLIEKYSN